ncbi:MULTISPECIES: Gfo/Idh/MocA family protein [Micrococcaceae]|uniref:Gfo/Idh/MocA family protein n=1 Tax=unclassified Kocuria TaxID=2649579 RepID=UPI0010124C0B|nr:MULTISPECIES: Gfo/Idh/MocA family oxidoreductase [unclassified Kocuria]
MTSTGTQDTVRLGIIGYGAQGSTYATFIAEGRVPHMRIGAVCDTDPERRAQAERDHPGVTTFSSYSDVLASGNVDAVVTCVPHYLHPEMGIEALRNGTPVLVEKPAGVYTKQVAELNRVAKETPDVPFAIMFNQRNNPLYRKIKDVIDAGDIGTLRRTNWIITTWWRPQGYYDQSAWRATWGGEGGGVLVNQAPHQLDLLQWMCGVPRSVFAKAAFGFRRNIPVEDEVTAVLDYGNGTTGVFITATHDLVGTDRLEILGDKGKIVVDGSKKAHIYRLRDDEQEISKGLDMEAVRGLFQGSLDPHDFYEEEDLEFESVWGEQHTGVLENFALHVLDGTPLLAPGSDGINGVRLANAIHLSAWKGEEVPLDFDTEEHLALLNRHIAEEGTYPQR